MICLSGGVLDDDIATHTVKLRILYSHSNLGSELVDGINSYAKDANADGAELLYNRLLCAQCLRYG